MRLSIRSMALLTILAPMLLPVLVLSVWHTSVRVGDARAGLKARGEHEVRYLADASSLALLVGDAETLRRLATSNLSDADGAAAVLFLDTGGRVVAAAGEQKEIDLARACVGGEYCDGEVPRYVFTQKVDAGADRPGMGRELGTDGPLRPQFVGTVRLSFDPERLASIQRVMLLHSVLVTLLALLVAWMVAKRFSRWLTDPMQRLSTVVARIQEGDLAARTEPSGSGELRELETGINAMADRVEASSVELKRRIDEAIAQLSMALADREQRNLELDAALTQAEQAAHVKDLFLARMSHELRTPLATVIGYSRLMRQSRSESQRADFYRTLEQASQILVRTVDDILTFVKLEERSLKLERREFDLEACIEDAVRMQAPAAHAKGLDIVCHVHGTLPCCVVGDSLRLSQVLANLISNAIKFTAVGVVTVWAGMDGEAILRIRVMDTGIGIASESIPQLFQPFVQGDESVTRRFGGSGLGLSIAASLVKALGGQIELQSNLGQGTCVTVMLPLVLPACDESLQAMPLQLRVVLLCPPDSAHSQVLRDYLGCCLDVREFHDAHELCQALSRTEYPEPDLCVWLEDAAVDSRSVTPSLRIPVVCLRRIGTMLAPTRDDHEEALLLPVRRRDLLEACLQRTGQVERIAGDCCHAPARGHARAMASSCLVVEDNALNRRMIATQLRTLGVRVIEAGGGDEALALLASRRPDLVLADVHMPGMDGVTLAALMRERHPDLPVYALTANVIGSEEKALADVGVRAVLYKPLDVDRLLEVLAFHVPPDAGWRLREDRGVTVMELRKEIERLHVALLAASIEGDSDAAIDAAHQLLGVARVFTEGDLVDECLNVERVLRAGDAEPVRQAVENLGVLLETGCRVSQSEIVAPGRATAPTGNRLAVAG